MLRLFLSYTAHSSPVSTLSLHDALPIFVRAQPGGGQFLTEPLERTGEVGPHRVSEDDRVGHLHHGRFQVHREEHAFVLDRKSTRLNSSHVAISYAVFCLKIKRTR